jgi:hypothetical protein
MSSRDARSDARAIDPSGHQGTQTDAVNETRGTTLTQQAGSMCCLSLRERSSYTVSVIIDDKKCK